MRKLFTKSAFKVALTCPAQLYYYFDKDNYPNKNADNEFMMSLAEGGFQVGELAKMYLGVTPENDLSGLGGYELPLQKTESLFSQGDVTIAEAAFIYGDCFVRTDIVRKNGNRIDLIEVKTKSWESGRSFTKLKGSRVEEVDAKIQEYMYDVAFQKYVLEHALPHHEIHAYLMMADKTKTATVSGVNQCFRIVRNGAKIKVRRSEDSSKLLNDEHILTAFDVDDVCNRIISGKIAGQDKLLGGMSFEKFVQEMSRKYRTHERQYCDLSVKCFSCPFYKTKGDPSYLRDGYKECWAYKAGFSAGDFDRPLLKDLWGGMGGSFKSRLLREGKYFLSDLSGSDFRMRTSDVIGLTPDERRLVQIATMTRRDDILPARIREGVLSTGAYVDIPGLKKEMDSWRYPLHMIDFETTSVALPFYAGMRPYEQIAFQFSHHTVSKGDDGSYHITHAGQYINMERGKFPNFDFVRELKRNLEGDDGTVFRYSHHENSILNSIRIQLSKSSEPDKDILIGFIEEITHREEPSENGKRKVRGCRDMVDLCDVVRRFYYHPLMKGSNSIKVVLPAVLNSSKRIQEKYSRPVYGEGALIGSLNIKHPEPPMVWVTFESDEDGNKLVANPYKKLPKVADYFQIDQEGAKRYLNLDVENLESIDDGGAALSAYGLIQFCEEGSSSLLALREALLRYCELDTLAMVFIWEYFNEVTEKYSE